MPPGLRGRRSRVALVIAVPTALVSAALVVPQVLGKPTAEVTWVQPMTAEVAVAGIATDQMFLVFTTVYILIPTLMVFLLLVLRPRVNRIVNIVVALFCAVGILSPRPANIDAGIGEQKEPLE